MSVSPGSITVRTVATFLLATWPRRAVLGVVLLIPVIVLVLGGFRPAPAESHDVEIGRPVDLGPMTVAPSAFFVSDETDRFTLDYREGEAWVGVIVTIENTTTTPIYLTLAGTFSGVVVPALADGMFVESTSAVPISAFRVADGSSGTIALPGVPTEVALLWAVTDADAVGDMLTVDMTEATLTHSFMSDQDKWFAFDGNDTWHVQVPRVNMPEVLYEEPT